MERDVAILMFDTAQIVWRLFRWMSHLAKFLDTAISSKGIPYLATAHAVARMQSKDRELVVNKAFESGDDHMVIIFLEVSGIKSASLDEKSPVGVQPKENFKIVKKMLEKISNVM